MSYPKDCEHVRVAKLVPRGSKSDIVQRYNQKMEPSGSDTALMKVRGVPSDKRALLRGLEQPSNLASTSGRPSRLRVKLLVLESFPNHITFPSPVALPFPV